MEQLVEKLVDAPVDLSDSDLETDESDHECYSSDEEVALKSHADFEGLPFEYDSYILENVSEGCPVRSLQSIDCQVGNRRNIVIPTGTTGSVLAIDRTAGLLGKSIQVYWNGDAAANLGRSCWVKPNTIELTDLISFDIPLVGDNVKVRKTILEPKYKWGKVCHSSIGTGFEIFGLHPLNEPIQICVTHSTS